MIEKTRPFDRKTGELNLVTETCKGSRCKIGWNGRYFKLKKILPEGHVFPYDFGFIPSTEGQDGDALDVLLLIDAEIGFPGCLVKSRLIGVIEAEQTEEGETVRNDRLLAVASSSRALEHIQSVEDLPPAQLDEIEAFFVSYNAQEGKDFKPIGRGDRKRAEKLVKSATKKKG